MLILTGIAALVLMSCLLQPELPLSRGAVREALGIGVTIKAKVGLGQAIIAISLTLLLFAAFWALQGDAPMILAMLLPELAAWLTTFEIATLAEALVGVGTAFVALRAAGAGTYVKGRVRARRNRRSKAAGSRAANDDDPAPVWLAA